MKQETDVNADNPPKQNERRGLFDHPGICWIGWREWFGHEDGGGFGCGWLPERIQDAFVTVANRTLCFLFGHASLAVKLADMGICVNCYACRKPLRTVGKSMHEWLEKGEPK